MFLDDPDNLSEQQNWYFGDIMGQLAYDLEKQVREELANRLAHLESFNKHYYRPNSYLHKWWARRCGSREA